MEDEVNYGRQQFQNSNQDEQRYNDHPTIDINYGLNMSQKQKQKRIKKLAYINKQLIQTLKKQNDQLSDRINRRKLKPKFKPSAGKLNKSIIQGDIKSKKEFQSVKKELDNAYKQIDMYQKQIKKHRGKSVSIDAIDKVNGLENQVKQQDKLIEKLQKQLKILQNQRKQQQNQIQVYDNQDNKRQLQVLLMESKNYKQKIKQAKKKALKRQDVEKKQQSYQIQLELALRKANDQYYPGKKQEKQKQIAEDVPQREWQILINRLQQLRKMHEQNSKKIGNLQRQKLKEEKQCKDNQQELKQKMKKLQSLKNKAHQLAKLATATKRNQSLMKSSKTSGEDFQDGNTIQLPKINPKRNSFLVGQDQRDPKKWVLSKLSSQQKGKLSSNSQAFSDKEVLKDLKGVKVYAIHVWCTSTGTPWIIQFYYTDQKNRMIPGHQPISHIPSHLQHQVFQLGQGDYLEKIQGVFDQKYLVGLTIKSKLGRQRSFIDQEQSYSNYQKFTFVSKNGEIPYNFYGGYSKQGNQVRICQIGCQFHSIA